jgi:hypothetical protein
VFDYTLDRSSHPHQDDTHRVSHTNSALHGWSYNVHKVCATWNCISRYYSCVCVSGFDARLLELGAVVALRLCVRAWKHNCSIRLQCTYAIVIVWDATTSESHSSGKAHFWLHQSKRTTWYFMFHPPHTFKHPFRTFILFAFVNDATVTKHNFMEKT